LENRPRRIRVAVLIVTALMAAASGCSKSDSANEATLVPEVTVTTVRRGSIVQNLTVSGNLTALPNRDAKIAALVPGRIERVLVTEGDSVHSGQLVAQVDPVSLRDQLVQADAAVSQARLSWRADIGLTGFIPGNSQPWGRAALYQARNSSSRCGESIT